MRKTIEVERELEPHIRKKLSDEMAHLVKEHQSLEEAKKASAAEYKNQMDIKLERIREIAGEITPGKVWRTLDCEVHYDFARDELNYFDVNTGELVLTEKRPQGSDLFREMRECHVMVACNGYPNMFRECFFRVIDKDKIIQFVEYDSDEVLKTESHEIIDRKFPVMNIPVKPPSTTWWSN